MPRNVDALKGVKYALNGVDALKKGVKYALKGVAALNGVKY